MDIVRRVKLIKGRKYWHWILLGFNGETVAASETYSDKNKAFKSAKKIAVQLKVVVYTMLVLFALVAPASAGVRPTECKTFDECMEVGNNKSYPAEVNTYGVLKAIAYQLRENAERQEWGGQIPFEGGADYAGQQKSENRSRARYHAVKQP